MASINTDGRVHASFIETFSNPIFPEVRFWPYYEGQKELVILRRALSVVKTNIYIRKTTTAKNISKRFR